MITCEENVYYLKRYVPETDMWAPLAPYSWRYTGNGAVFQNITLGWRPAAVRIIQRVSYGTSGAHEFKQVGGMNSAAAINYDDAIVTDGFNGNRYLADRVLKLQADGFTVYNTNVGSNNANPNTTGVTYFFIAYPLNGGESYATP